MNGSALVVNADSPFPLTTEGIIEAYDSSGRSRHSNGEQRLYLELFDSPGGYLTEDEIPDALRLAQEMNGKEKSRGFVREPL